jgi:N-acetylglucosamine-6-phosphate deacetylase
MSERLGVEAALVDGVLVAGDVEVVDGRVAAFGLGGKRGRGFAVPGFIDLQVNGFGGVDFLDADAAGYRRAGDALLETGVTAYLPTLITSPEEQVLAAMREVPVGDTKRPRILGMHLEGPFLSPTRLGTIRPRTARPRSGVARTPARCRPGAVDDPGAGTAGSRRVGRPLIERGVASRWVTATQPPSRRTQRSIVARAVTHSSTRCGRSASRSGYRRRARHADDVIVSIILDGIHLAPRLRVSHGVPRPVGLRS